MKPIQERAESALSQGLRCVQYRLPNRYPLKPAAYSCALGLRYGLIAAAAAFYALETADSTEERELKQLFQYWPVMVTEHYRQEITYRLPPGFETVDSTMVGRLAGSPLRVSLALRKQFLPLQRVLEIASEIFARDHRTEITSDSWLLARPRTVKIFRSAGEESVRYSMHFFERRRSGLEEVSEIALLGE
jgi:hypothetical protein